MQKNEIVKLDELGIKDKIYSIRGYQVMLDRDLAELYEVETRVLNQAVKRNIERFPVKFCFKLNNSEIRHLRSQFVISNAGGRRYLPYAFTEQGVAMLAGILKSDKAIKTSIQIVETFVELRKIISSNALLFQRVENTEIKLLEHDRKLDKVFSALENKDNIPQTANFLRWSGIRCTQICVRPIFECKEIDSNY